MHTQSNFIELKFSNKIWAIGSIHSDLESFNSIKEYVLEKFTKGDKLVLLGNAIGIKNQAKETICLQTFIFHQDETGSNFYTIQEVYA